MTNETKQAKWTPAPWEVAEKTDLGDVFVEASSGERVAMACWEGEWSDSMGAATEANAYLIAAAPALYEALNKLRSYLRDNSHIRTQCDDLATELGFAAATSAADQALAKANGPAVGHTDAF